MKKNIIFIIVITLLTITCGILVYFNFKINLKCGENNFAEEKLELEMKISQLGALVESLNNQINHSKPNEPEENPEKCTFIRTLRYIDIIDYQGQVKEKYALFGEFQGTWPIMLRFEPDFKMNFEKNKIYEITFTGYTNGKDDLQNYEIVSYKETYKNGLDQIQESCKAPN